MEPSNNYAGTDISKSKLDVHHRSWEQVSTFPNTTAGIKRLLRALPKGSHIICEATGGYERPLVAAAHAAGVAVSVVNARAPRDLARSLGQLAKTDAIDAATLTRYGEVAAPAAQAAPDPAIEALSALYRRRESLVGQLTREKNSLEKTTDRFVISDIRSLIRVLEGRLVRLKKQIDQLFESSTELGARRARLQQIKGVGEVASAAVVAECPELGSLSDKQAAALAGLAPFNRDSGTWRGQRTIAGGRARLRRALHMPALTAATHNPIMRAFYQRLIARGKPHKVALTAVMRKLICLLNRMLADPNFQPSS